MKVIFSLSLILVLTGCNEPLVSEPENQLPEVVEIVEPTEKVEPQADLELEITEDPLKQIDLISETLEGLTEL